MAEEYKRRYVRIENLIYMMVILLSVIALSVYSMTVIRRDYQNAGCMLDGITILSQGSVYMPVVLVTVLVQFKLLSSDENAMIVIRYQEKSICGKGSVRRHSFNQDCSARC